MSQPAGPSSNERNADRDRSDRSQTNRYHVAVYAVPEVREKLMPALSLIPGIAMIDARIRLFDLPGVLPELFDRETADLLVDSFHSAGVEAARIPEAELPVLDHRPTVHHARCVSTGLEFVGTSGATETVLPWMDLALASIGVVPEEHSSPADAAPTPALDSAHATRGTHFDFTATHGPEMWLVREDPFLAWRIDHVEMNYEYLGDRMSTSAAVNFRTFAQDIAEHAPAAYLTPSARAYLETQRADEERFDSRAAHAKAVQLHVLLRRSMRRD